MAECIRMTMIRSGDVASPRFRESTACFRQSANTLVAFFLPSILRGIRGRPHSSGLFSMYHIHSNLYRVLTESISPRGGLVCQVKSCEIIAYYLLLETQPLCSWTCWARRVRQTDYCQGNSHQRRDINGIKMTL